MRLQQQQQQGEEVGAGWIKANQSNEAPNWMWMSNSNVVLVGESRI
jgi:hypothetical protein